jgi:hypothetical protein
VRFTRERPESMREPRTVEVVTPGGAVIGRFLGFAQLKAGDRFRVLDEDDQPGPIWLALGDPYQVTRGRKQLAIQAREVAQARELERT